MRARNNFEFLLLLQFKDWQMSQMKFGFGWWKTKKCIKQNKKQRLTDWQNAVMGHQGNASVNCWPKFSSFCNNKVPLSLKSTWLWCEDFLINHISARLCCRVSWNLTEARFDISGCCSLKANGPQFVARANQISNMQSQESLRGSTLYCTRACPVIA